MLLFGLSWEISVLLALMALTLIVSSELLMFYYGKANVRLNKKRLNQAALLVSALFTVTIVFRVFTLIIEG